MDKVAQYKSLISVNEGWFEIEDDGIGMHMATVGKVFLKSAKTSSRFWSTAPEKHRLGISELEFLVFFSSPISLKSLPDI